uniref:chitinase n=1 Tax=Anthurium amnicola TaxID=1678845 RepID=A0A1D1YFA3_9ARAE
MANPSPLPLALFLMGVMVVASMAKADGASIATYWGQNQEEGKLSKACATGNYDYITIASLTTFGSGRAPALDLHGHCNATRGGCSGLGREIRACQRRGVKVLISLGAGAGQEYSLNSSADATQVAAYLFDSFLGGKSSSRPFGSTVLDGVDFAVAGNTRKDRAHWDDLARALANHSTAERKVFLTAAPQCAYPDRTLHRALDTGLFDIVWVRFYNHAACRYSADGFVPLKLSWERWNAKVPAAKVFIGLPAAGDAAQDGYVPPENFTAQVLPFISNFPKYGGVMLWDRYYDMKNQYSEQVKCDVKECESSI